MNSFELFAAWTGLVGGASGFVALFLQFSTFYRDAPRLRIELSKSIDPDTGKNFFSIEVVNKGAKPITLGSIGIKYKNKNHTPFVLFPLFERSGSEFPIRLEGHSSEFWIVSERSIRSSITDQKTSSEICAYVNTRTGKTKESNKLKVSKIDIK